MELTPEQKEKIQVYLDEGLRLGLGTESIDRKTFEPNLAVLWKYLGHDLKKIFYVDSPFMANVLANTLELVHDPATKITTSRASLEKTIQSFADKAIKDNDKLKEAMTKCFLSLEPDYRPYLIWHLKKNYAKITANNSNRVYGNQELYWIQTYRFINNELPVEKTKIPLEEIFNSFSQCGWIYPYADFAVVSRKPRALHVTAERLHSQVGPAMEYKDGFRIYAINGTYFDYELAQKFIEQAIEDIDPQSVLNIKNVEQRQAIIKRVGINRLFKHLKPKKLESKGQYELYTIKVNFGLERVYLKMQNPSVDELHIEAVHPDCKTVDQALNWRNFGKFDMMNGVFIEPRVLT